MAKTKKYVRILKAKYESMWYADKIGEVFELTGETVSFYDVRVPGVGRLVNVEDAELIVTEKRPAKVGERILIVNDEFDTDNNGQIHRVCCYVSESSVNNEHIITGDGTVFLTSEYEVIVNNEIKNEEADEMESKLLIDNAKTVFEKKGDRYFGYKSRLGDIIIGGTYSYAFVVHYAKTNEDVVMIPGDVNAVTTPVSTTEEERLWKPEKSAQERRDEIVERAKADVERLRTNNRLWRTFDITFDINREKRTVEAIAKKPNSRTAFYGTAVCAPNDCFNIHIGKAIAIHLALGLEVPDEYLNAPQPTEVRVGDVVGSFEINEVADYYGKIVDVNEDKVFYEDGGFDYLPTVTEGIDEDGEESFLKIIDDSRTEVGE
ncbi:hypothetical protein MOF21_08520 [Bacillus haynesii]|uniref:hypothetical protein n=1 Tax=Bacillus haynesii TaxID=1925021 RepID=UPI00227E8D1E|nr:hypothetical protein [Bacillus haynesii]MCY9329979.1 hypothetical protein [Bacillus haynesii]